MDYVHIDTISMEWSILYLQGSHYRNFLILIHFCPRRLFLSYSADPDEMLPYGAFHLGLQCLPKYLSTSIQNEKG